MTPTRNMPALTVLIAIVLFCAPITAIAAPISLDNDVDVSWADIPCQVDPALCVDPILVFGAPVIVPDAADAGDLLHIDVDFLSVGLNETLAGPGTPTPLILNVGDASFNEVFIPGTATPLRLTYLINPSGLITEAPDLQLTLNDFSGFDLLPDGDLVFTVTFKPRLSLIDRSADRPDQAVIVTVSGAGSPVSVPEPTSLWLSTIGIAAACVARKRRSALRRR